MKSPESKSSARNAVQKSTESNPFFSKTGAGVFGPGQDKTTPFFAGKNPVQAKLKVHPANDLYEKEADNAADKVVSQMHAPPQVQRKEGDEEGVQAMRLGSDISSIQTQRAFESPTSMEQNSASNGEQEMALQAKAEGEAHEAGSGLEAQLSGSKGKGAPLPEDTRSKMESGFGADFGGVRIHNDSNAAQMNKDLGARAFTHGNDIYFSQGEYKPSTTAGDHLLAHELTHTVQQGAAKTGGVQRKETGIKSTKHDLTSAPDQLPVANEKDLKSKSNQLQNFGASPADSGRGEDPSTPAFQVQRMFTGPGIQRRPGINDVIAKDFEHLQKGNIKTDSKEIIIPTLKVPGFKVPLTTYEIKLPKTERSGNQATEWDKYIKTNMNIQDKLDAKVAGGGSPNLATPAGAPIYVLKVRQTSGDQSNYVIGDKEAIKEGISRPRWDKRGNQTFYHVDHKHEFQLGGPDLDMENLWLLEAQANMSSGRNIKTEKDNKIKDLLEAASVPGPKQVWARQPNLETIKNAYTIVFKRAVGGLDVAGNPDKTYTKEEITSGKSLDGLQNLSTREIDRLGLSRDNVLNLFTRQNGGSLYKIEDWDSRAGEKSVHLGLGVNIDINKIKFDPQSGGNVEGNLFKRSGKIKKYLKEKQFSFVIKPMPGVPHTGYIDSSSIRSDLAEKLEANAMSPVSILDASLEPGKGLVAKGKILPSIPIIEKAGIDLVLDGDNIYLEKVFNTGEFKVPAPFKISDSSLSIRAGTQGIEFEGQVDFGIDKVGEGSVSAFVNSQLEFGVKGHFEFDKKLFDNAKVEVAYLNGNWAVTGTIEIPKGKVKGIKKASATIAYNEGTLAAAGQVEPEIKGVKEGSFEIKYSQDQFLVSGKLQLSPEIPRLKKGEINITLESNPEGGNKLKGFGIAEFDFPGISTGLNVQYDDGLMTVEATVNFEKGIAKGDIKVGATNRPVDANGNPIGEPGERWVIYGSGTVTVKVTKWLQATAGVKFLPNGEMEVLGRVELPSTVDVFPRKGIDKNLLSIPTIEIPLFAIPLGPKSLGLVAQINGGLDFTAGIGPGQIQQLYGEIKYNPAKPDETSLTGGGRFVIPADAGLKLHADLSLGLSVGFASLTGGIEVAGSVGLQGEAAANVNLNWSKDTGLELFAEGSIKVTPKFKFDVNLIARAKLDLFLFEISKEWRHNLASVEWGPGIEFGLIFPIHYKEGEEFNISFDDIQVIKPDIDIPSMVKGIAGKVKEAF